MRAQRRVNPSKKIVAGNFATTASVLGLFPSDRPAPLGPTMGEDHLAKVVSGAAMEARSDRARRRDQAVRHGRVIGLARQRN